MAFKLITGDIAEIDLEDGIEWYETKQRGLGKRFYNDFVTIAGYLILNPYLFPLKSLTYREAKLKTFPFVIIYEIEDDNVIIHAIFNTSKNPGKKPNKF